MNSFCISLSLSLVVALFSFGLPADAQNSAAKPAVKPAADKSEKTAVAKDTAKPAPEPVIENVVSCSAEDLVAKPHEFMGKNVKFNANFFAFSNLALDYKPAFRASKTHLSFLILRGKGHVPLSELKLAMAIPKEKDPDTQLLATLKDGDSLEITGKVFSAALDDPWVEILKLKKLNTDDKDKKADASAKAAESKAPATKPQSGRKN